jgi:hypothetical protein
MKYALLILLLIAAMPMTARADIMPDYTSLDKPSSPGPYNPNGLCDPRWDLRCRGN